MCQHGAPLPTLVFEAVGGGWSGGLGFLSCWLARESSLPSFDSSLSFAQRISSTLHGENARAILKRSPTVSSLTVLASAFRSSLKTPLNYLVSAPLLPLSPSVPCFPPFFCSSSSLLSSLSLSVRVLVFRAWVARALFGETSWVSG